MWMNTDIRDYTICGLVDPETQRIMFVFMTVGESTQRVIHHNAHPTEEWEEKTGLGGTAKRDWIQSPTDRGLEAEWVVLERVRADAAGLLLGAFGLPVIVRALRRREHLARA